MKKTILESLEDAMKEIPDFTDIYFTRSCESASLVYEDENIKVYLNNRHGYADIVPNGDFDAEEIEEVFNDNFEV